MDLGQWCAHLQKCHLSLSQNNVAAAKNDVLAASNCINTLLRTSGHSGLVRHAAQHTIDLYRRVLEKGAGALPAHDRILWLNSAVHGRAWYPEIPFGTHSTFSVPPLAAAETLLLPALGPGFEVELRDLAARAAPSDSADSADLSTLHQDILTNCSFVSSLISIAEVGKAGDLRRLVSDPAAGFLKVRLLVNGAFREITISTHLPVLKAPHHHRSLFVKSSDPRLLWPAYLEKAFLMLSGEDYRFTGSNMANDTYTLTGWLPEVRLTSAVTASEVVALLGEKARGFVMLGLGTGLMSSQLAASVGVVPEHDYVLSAYDPDNEQFRLINPWATEHQRDRILCISAASLCHFDYLYLNWSPAGEKYHTALVCTPARWPQAFLGDKTQISVCNESSEDQEVTVMAERFIGGSCDFGVSVWKGSRHMLFSDSQCVSVARGEHDMRCQSLRVTLEKHSDYIVSFSCKKASLCTFAVSVFRQSQEVRVAKAKNRLPRMQTVEGEWTSQTSGGNWANETFINNPQYDLQVGETTHNLFLALTSTDPAQAVNIHLLHCEAQEAGKRLRIFDQSRLVFSQSYKRQLQCRDIPDIQPGHYKLLVSTYEREPGTYRLLVANDGETVQMSRTPQSIGTFVQSFAFDWNNGNRRKIFITPTYRNTAVTVHLLTGEAAEQTASNYRPAIRASFFDAFTNEPVLVNSQWNDCVYGVFIDCVLPENDRDYILLVERFETGSGKCRLSVGSTHRLALEDTK